MHRKKKFDIIMRIRTQKIVCLFTLVLVAFLYFLKPQNAIEKSVRSVSDHVFRAEPNTRDSKCPLPWRPTYEEPRTSAHPLVALDPKKFLLPMLINGPNNQLVGFRKSMFVAIRMNRTIVLPTFHKHNANIFKSTNKVNPLHRVDLEYMKRFIRFVTLDRLRERCHGNIDAVYRLQETSSNHYAKVEAVLDMKLKRKKDGSVLEYPADLKLKGNERFIGVPTDRKGILDLYPNKARCALHPFHFANLNIREKKPSGPEPTSIDLTALKDEKLYGEIVRFTRTPPYIVTMATQFIADVMGGRPYVSVHWRYDRKDWMKRCLDPVPHAKKEFQQKCDIIVKFRPVDIASAIHSSVRNLPRDDVPHDVYIASPPSEVPLLLEVGKEMKKKYNWKLFTSDDVVKFWKTTYRSCDWLWDDVTDDVLSTTEIEICSRGIIFHRSDASTWSNNVKLKRTDDVISQRFMSHDSAIFDLVQRVVHGVQ